MSNVSYEIERLLKFALKKGMISKYDIIPTRNALIDVLKLEGPFEGEVLESEEETPVEEEKDEFDNEEEEFEDEPSIDDIMALENGFEGGEE